MQYFETYVEISERDKDDPIVENLSSVFYSAGFDWLITVFGPTIVIVDAAAIADGTVQTIQGNELWVTPSEHVIDSMEALMDEDSEAYKRLPSSIDSGFNMRLAHTLENLFDASKRTVNGSIQTIPPPIFTSHLHCRLQCRLT